MSDTLTDHCEHPLYDVLFLQSSKRNMNVLLDIAKRLIKTLEIAVVFSNFTFWECGITSVPVKV
jgi:hypothetical protein